MKWNLDSVDWADFGFNPATGRPGRRRDLCITNLVSSERLTDSESDSDQIQFFGT